MFDINSLTQSVSTQLKSMNLPEDQISGILSQVTSKFGDNFDPKSMDMSAVQGVLSNIMASSGVAQETVGNIVQNVTKDGFQMSDFTDAVAGKLPANLPDVGKMAEDAKSNVTGESKGFFDMIADKIGSIFGTNK